MMMIAIEIDEDDGAYQLSRHRALDACFYAAGRMRAHSTVQEHYGMYTRPRVNSRGCPPCRQPFPRPK
jgi:hypothetical protein